MYMHKVNGCTMAVQKTGTSDYFNGGRIALPADVGPEVLPLPRIPDNGRSQRAFRFDGMCTAGRAAARALV